MSSKVFTYNQASVFKNRTLLKDTKKNQLLVVMLLFFSLLITACNRK